MLGNFINYFAQMGKTWIFYYSLKLIYFSYINFLFQLKYSLIFNNDHDIEKLL